MYKIIDKQLLAPRTHYMRIAAPVIASSAKAGQFVMIRTDEKGERVPLTIADYDEKEGSVTLVFQEAGKSTAQLAQKALGDSILDILGPQGNPTDIEDFGNVVVVGGGIGIAPVYPIARSLHARKNRITLIAGYRSAENVFWEDKLTSVSDKFILMTNDGSRGEKGFVTEALARVIGEEKVDRVIAIGPPIMMKAVADVTRDKGVKTIVSLNSLMVCGMGMCGACRVTVGGKTRFTCMDGPDFDAHQVDFPELMKRLDTYKVEEKVCLDDWERTGCN